MGLCGGFRCGCGVTTDGSIDITGSGEPGDPFVLSAVDGLSAQFTRAAAQTVGSSLTANVSWTAETIDPDGWGVPTTSTLTCPEAGLYTIAWTVVKTGGAGAINGTRLQIETIYMPSQGVRGSLTTLLSAGDDIVLEVANSAGGSLDFTATISIIRIS